MLCKLICHGRLTREIKLEHSERGLPFCQFSLASPRYAGPQKGEIVEYPDFIAYRTTAENLAKYAAQKGTELLVEAHYTSYKRNIEGSQYPVKVVVFEVDKFEFCGTRKSSDQTESVAAPVQPPKPEQLPRSKDTDDLDFSGFEVIDGDPQDLPF
ncbi:single-stranded DNA-binding protein [Hydrogenoanaerobacterium saccharovorans]|uniref:single-stranded DNA-binding protein n=1 Tax=Hydrogenoanaerobacterium saccharovorans TaxID=474960 RepID=UPI0023DF3BD8|nr:single-stranded DNA-binding protein [Hydrogenoanaerobacterium saccharovorans]